MRLRADQSQVVERALRGRDIGEAQLRLPLALALLVVLGLLLMQRRVVALAGAGALAALTLIFLNALSFVRVIGLAQQGDATALFTMFRNVFGSVGISLSTALITSRTQVHMAYLSYGLTPANANYASTLAQFARAIQHLGSTAAQSTQKAAGQLYQTFIAQAGFLAYQDVFLYCALVALGFAPFTLFFSSAKKTGGAPAAACPNSRA